MGLFVKKAMTGGYRQVPQNEATHYIEDIGEYNQMQRQLQSLRNKLQQASDEVDRWEAYCRKAAEEQIAAVQKDYENQILQLRTEKSVLESDITACSQKLKDLEGLNANLLRIMRERANAARNIIPKKQHDGYVITTCRQYHDYKEITHSWDDYQKQSALYKKKNRYIRSERIPVTSWKLSVQTPYSASIPIIQAEARIFTEIKSILINEFGCEGIQDQNGSYPLHPDDKCILYRWDFSADLRSGLWTIDLYMTRQPVILESRMKNASELKGKKG